MCIVTIFLKAFGTQHLKSRLVALREPLNAGEKYTVALKKQVVMNPKSSLLFIKREGIIKCIVTETIRYLFITFKTERA